MGWRDYAHYGAYALNPSLALGADSLGGNSGEMLEDAANGNPLGSRFDQANGQTANPGSFQMPGIGSAGAPGGQYGSPPRQGGGGTQGGLGGMAAGGPAWIGGAPPKSGYDQFQDRYTDYLGSVRDRNAPQIGEFQNAQQSAIAGQQQTLADQLAARSRGENSIAELQLRQAADQGMNQQRSMAMGARPGQSAMAARLASQNMQRGQAGLGQAAAIARAQEADMAAGRLGGLLGGMRGSDEQMSQWNAGQQNTRTGAQAQMDQSQMGMNDAANQGLLGLSQGAADSQMQANTAQEQINAQRYGASLGVPTQQEVLLGGLEGGIKAGAISDQRAKTNVKDGGAAADQFLGSLQPQSYNYKPSYMLPGELAKSQGGETPTLGVMAQDVKSTPMGAPAVKTDDKTGMYYLDPRRLPTALAAGLGRLNERLNALEGGER